MMTATPACVSADWTWCLISPQTSRSQCLSESSGAHSLSKLPGQTATRLTGRSLSATINRFGVASFSLRSFTSDERESGCWSRPVRPNPGAIANRCDHGFSVISTPCVLSAARGASVSTESRSIRTAIWSATPPGTASRQVCSASSDSPDRISPASSASCGRSSRRAVKGSKIGGW